MTVAGRRENSATGPRTPANVASGGATGVKGQKAVRIFSPEAGNPGKTSILGVASDDFAFPTKRLGAPQVRCPHMCV